MAKMPLTDNVAGPEECLTRSVVEALSQNPALEAVTFDRARHSISVATLGKTDLPQLAERISNTVKRAETAAGETSCALLVGHGDCRTCVRPLSESERTRITIRHE